MLLVPNLIPFVIKEINQKKSYLAESCLNILTNAITYLPEGMTLLVNYGFLDEFTILLSK